MVQYANPDSPVPASSFESMPTDRPMTNWLFLTLQRRDGVVANVWGKVALARGETTQGAVDWYYASAVERDPSLKGASLTDVKIYPYRLRRRGLLVALGDAWARLTYRPKPLAYPTEMWAVLTDEGLVSVANTMDLAEELLFAAVSEGGGRTVEDLREEYALDLKLGDWCLASKATGYRIRDMRITKIPASWSER